MFCYKCGKEIVEGSLFCSACGMKIAGKENEKSILGMDGNTKDSNYLKRGYMYLEDSEWEKAKNAFDFMLNQDIENVQAYIGIFLSEHHCESLDVILDKVIDIKSDKNWKRAKSFSDEKRQQELLDIEKAMQEKIDVGNYEEKYQDVLTHINNASKISDYDRIINLLKSLSEYKESIQLLEQCEKRKKELEAAENERKELEKRQEKEELYNDAVNLFNGRNELQVQRAKVMFKSLGDYRNSKEMLQKCEKYLCGGYEYEASQEERSGLSNESYFEYRERERKKAVQLIVAIASVCAICATFFPYCTVSVLGMSTSVNFIEGDGKAIVCFAVFAFLLVIFRKYKATIVPTLINLGILLYDVATMKGRLESEDMGAFVKLDFGAYILIVVTIVAFIGSVLAYVWDLSE